MATTSAAVRQLSDGNSQGTSLGITAADKIGFYGATPVARLAGGVALSTLTASSVLATSVSPASSGGILFTSVSQGFTWTSQAQANAVVTGINALIVDQAAMFSILRQMRGQFVSTGLFTGT